MSSDVSAVRLAIVGVGWAGTRLVRAASELGGQIVVTSLVDPDSEQLGRAAAELPTARTHPALEDALLDDIDAVAICTPHALHAAQTLAAIAAGKHVLVEKPMALDLTDADRMVDAADRAGVVLGVAENEAHEPWVDALREMVRSGEPLGGLAFATIVAGHRAPDPAYPGRRSWLTEPAAGGTGSWILHGTHTVATCRRVLGDIATVYAREHRTSSYRRPDLEATMALLMTLSDGTPVTLVQTPEVDLGTERKTITLHGDQGVIRADRVGWTLHRAGVRPPIAEHGEWHQGRLSAYALELDAFAAAIREGRPMTTSGRSERDTLAVVLAAIESVRTGLPAKPDAPGLTRVEGRTAPDAWTRLTAGGSTGRTDAFRQGSVAPAPEVLP